MKKSRFTNIRAWITTICTALFFFYWFIQLSLNNTLHDFYITKFHIVSYGFFTSMYLIGNVIMFMPAGLILDKYKTKRVVVISLFLMVLGVLGLYLVNNKILAYFCMLLVGFSGTFSLLSVLRMAVKVFPLEKVAFPIGLSITLGMCGGLIGNSLGDYLFRIFNSGEFVQVLNVLLGGGILVIIVLFVKEPEMNNNSNEVLNRGIFEVLTTVLKNHQNWYAGLYMSLLNLPIMILDFSFGQQYLKSVFHQSSASAATISSMIFIGFIIASPVFGKLSDMFGLRKPLMIFGSICLFISLSVLGFDHSISLLGLILIFFFIGIVSSAQSLGYPVISESNDSSVVATANAIGSLLIMGGGAVAQNIFGMIQLGVGYKIAYYILPIGALFAILLSTVIKETGWKRVD